MLLQQDTLRSAYRRPSSIEIALKAIRNTIHPAAHPKPMNSRYHRLAKALLWKKALPYKKPRS
jgi:hypothetical protein